MSDDGFKRTMEKLDRVGKGFDAQFKELNETFDRIDSNTSNLQVHIILAFSFLAVAVVLILLTAPIWTKWISP